MSTSCHRGLCDISEDAFLLVFYLFRLFCLPLCKHLTRCFTETALQKIWLDLNPPLIIYHNTQGQILQTLQARVLKCPYLPLDPVNRSTHSEPCSLIYWTLHAPKLPISDIAFGGRDTELLSARLSLTVLFCFYNIVPILNYWMSTVSPTLLLPPSCYN